MQAAHILPLVASLPDGLDTLVGDRGYRLSGGEKQRIAIARLLLKAPDIVVLDEATAHLDSESEVGASGAHHLRTGRRAFAPQAVTARLTGIPRPHARIVERGHHNQLLAEAVERYAELYRIQFERQDHVHGGTTSSGEQHRLGHRAAGQARSTR